MANMTHFHMTEQAARVALNGGTPQEVRSAGICYQTQGDGKYCPELGDTLVDPAKVSLTKVEQSIKTLHQIKTMPKTFAKAFPNLAKELTA